MLGSQRQHAAVVRNLRRLRLPAAVGGGLLDWYAAALRRWAGEHDAETYFGATIHCDPVDSIQQKILLFGCWEPGVSRVIEDSLAAGDTFIDIGANIGYDTLLAASRVGTSGRVVAIEASPRIFGLLSANIERNHELAQQIRAVNVAISDRPGQLDLYEFGANNIGATTTLPSRRGRRCATVAAARLGDVITPAERGRVRLIKIDVEGAEPAILRDIVDHRDEYPARMELVVEANPQEAGFADIFDRLQAAGFTAWAIENRYSNGWYLRWRAPRLRRVVSIPTEMQDLLLTRAVGS